jgi:four helix bundle protein
MNFVEECYTATRTFPREELYGLTSQLRRAAVSIPSNVAEGYCRRKKKPYLNHVSIALGSHAELETCLEIASRLKYLNDPTFESLDRRLASVGRLLHALHQSLEERVVREEPPRHKP